MQENNFLLCLRNPCENTFLKLQIFVFFLKREFKKMLGYWPYATLKKTNFDIYIYIYIYIYICVCIFAAVALKNRVF